LTSRPRLVEECGPRDLPVAAELSMSARLMPWTGAKGGMLRDRKEIST
jgi:hypothetical protein